VNHAFRLRPIRAARGARVEEGALKAAGAAPEHVTKVQVYLTDVSDRDLIGPPRVAYFGANPPSSTLVGVAALVDPRFTLEIDCEA
jgi:2-iminobutanoate/2-iminopropanoate deaminase